MQTTFVYMYCIIRAERIQLNRIRTYLRVLSVSKLIRTTENVNKKRNQS